MTDPDLQQLLSQLRDEPAPFPSIGPSVLAHVERERQRRALVGWAFGTVAAAAALVFMTFALRAAWRVQPMPAPRIAAVKPPRIERSPAPVAVHRTVRRIRPLPQRSPFKTESLTVKLVSDDPNVVIYWIVAGQGE